MPPTGPKPRDAVERFMEKVRQTDGGCWLWTGQVQPNGYGRFGIGSRTDGTRKKVLAHRWSYEHFVGPIPAGMTIDHLCGVRNCVKPAHLEPVHHAVNLRRGDTEAARNAAKTHCPQGHPYDAENLVVNRKGQRTCRACHQQKSRLDYYRKKGRRVTPDLTRLDGGPVVMGDVVCPKCGGVIFKNYLNDGLSSIQCNGPEESPHRPVMAMLRPYAA
jgi:hypothetical protein